jgi:acetoin:2,6-dichlorophenolindophenol oxidoreductase subunit alpha
MRNPLSRRYQIGWLAAASMPELVVEQPPVDIYLELYSKMLLIRNVELACQDLYMKGLLHGTTHLCTGQEAVAVGANSVLGPDDRVACTYRGHGHSLALGMDVTACLAELLGRRTGICGGRSGSMNLVDLSHRLIGCFGIVGGSIAAATGAALALRGSGRLAVAYFGDGAVNQAYFSECLNFAKVFNLPVVYVCENNMYGEFTPMETVTAGSIMGRVEALEINAKQVDGMDVGVMRAAMQEAVDRVRAGQGPVFLEAMTYRFAGHSKSDPGRYRRPGELESWQQRDPLKLARQSLISKLGLSDQELKKLESAVLENFAAARQAAENAPFPDPSEPATEFKD